MKLELAVIYILLLAFATSSPMLYKRNPDEKYEPGKNDWNYLRIFNLHSVITTQIWLPFPQLSYRWPCWKSAMAWAASRVTNTRPPTYASYVSRCSKRQRLKPVAIRQHFALWAKSPSCRLRPAMQMLWLHVSWRQIYSKLPRAASWASTNPNSHLQSNPSNRRRPKSRLSRRQRTAEQPARPSARQPTSQLDQSLLLRWRLLWYHCHSTFFSSFFFN